MRWRRKAERQGLNPGLEISAGFSALALLVARALLVDHVDATSAPDDLIVRTNFFNRGSHLHEVKLSKFPNGNPTMLVNSVS